MFGWIIFVGTTIFGGQQLSTIRIGSGNQKELRDGPGTEVELENIQFPYYLVRQSNYCSV